MTRWSFVQEPPGARVVFEVGGLGRVAGEARRLGRRVLLLAGGHEASYADQVADDLGGALVARIRDVAEHVPVGVAAAATEQARAAVAEVLVCLGGGSATGLAKAIARETRLPILAVPTTYAGSEMTPIWGLTGDDGKCTGRDPAVAPRVVIYDPALTCSLPPATTAASGMNALAHCVEGLYARATAPVTALLAAEGIRALAAALPGCVSRPDDLEARSEALYGAWLAGWVLGTAGMGLHHRLAHVLGGTYRLPHGGVHSVLLPQVAAFNAAAAPAALGQAAHALDADGPAAVGAALFDLAGRLGAPTSLAALGLPEDALDAVAAELLAAPVDNPGPVDRDGVRRLLRGAYAGERP